MATTSATMKLTEPDVNDKVEDTITALAANFALIDALYPVGTIYESTKSTNPGTFIGGTWTALTGRMLIGAGTDYPAGTTGGAATHTITVDEMPSHSHAQNVTSTAVAGTSTRTDFASDGAGASFPQGVNTDATGGGQAMSVMNPYKAVYMWERTA